MPAKDAIEVGALGATVVTRFGAVAQGALSTEHGFAGVGVGTEDWCGAHQPGKHCCRRYRSHVVPLRTVDERLRPVASFDVRDGALDARYICKNITQSIAVLGHLRNICSFTPVGVVI